MRHGNILIFRPHTYGEFFRKITNVFLNSEQYKKLIDLEIIYKDILKSDPSNAEASEALSRLKGKKRNFKS